MQKEAEKHVHKDKGKEKVCGTSIGYSTLLTMFVQEVVNLTLDNDMGSQQGKKGLMWLMLESCQCCIDWGEPCKEPPAGSKGTACKRCPRLHITYK